jgi:hypothetical protein
MRWIYLDASNSQEAAGYAAVVRRIDAWWEAFVAKSEAIGELFARRSDWDLPAWMDRHFHAISPSLMWEYGPAVTGKGHRLVITPERKKYLRPLVQTVLERAPKLAGWEFYPYRLPESVEMAGQMVATRARGDLRGTLATAMIGNHNRIDLRFYSPTTAGGDDQQALHNAFVATETLLGEQILDKWIGTIDVGPLREPAAIGKRIGGGRRTGPSLLSLDRLKPTVDSVIAAIQDQLPDEPLHALPWDDESGIQWTMFELKPVHSDDFSQRKDLLVAVTANELLWRSFHEDSSFCSERFSRHHERFCYLKIDSSEGPRGRVVADRGKIEDAINAVLIPARAGRVIGGGTGSRYSYIDLALADVDVAIPLICSRLRGERVPRRSWLLFFDAPLAHEWIGMYKDTPEPPGAATDSGASDAPN